MPGFAIRRFAGEPLGLEKNAGPYGFALRAIDADFSTGTFRPVHKDRMIGPLPPAEGDLRSFALDGCCVVSGSQCEAVTTARLPCVRHFRVKDGVLEHSASLCGPWDRLGHPCITVPPSVLTSQIQTEGKTILRQYVYAVINEYDEIEAVSPPSNGIVADWDRSALVTNIIAPMSRIVGPRRVRLYSTAPDQALGPNAAPSDINFFGVTSVTYGSNSASHDPKVHAYAEALVPEDYNPPPFGLHSLAHWGGRQLAGLAEGFLWFSLPNNYAIWPSDAVMRFEDAPLAFVAGRQNGYVLTCARPVLVSLAADCKDSRCHSAATIDASLPVLAPRSAAIHEEGVIYASTDGLVFLQGTRWMMLTAGMSRDQWRQMQPERAVGVMHKGSYILTTPAGTWKIRLPGNPFDTAAARPDMVRLSVPAENWYRTPDDRLFYSAENQYAYEWDSDGPLQTAVWESEPIYPNSRVRWVYVQCSRDAQYAITVTPFHGRGGPDTTVPEPTQYRSGPGWVKLPPSVDRGWWTLHVRLKWGEIENLTLSTSRTLQGIR